MDKVILSPIELDTLLNGLRSVVKEELHAQQQQQIGEKLLSPAETCKLFQPTISRPTLQSWTDQGLLIDYRIGGRVYYKYSEVIEAAKHLKRYKPGRFKEA